MSLHEYLQLAKQKFSERGTQYMLSVIDTMIAEQQSFEQAIEQARRNRNSYDRFSLDYQYYWSVLTYLESLQSCYAASSN